MRASAAVQALAEVLSKLGLDSKRVGLDKSRSSKLFVKTLERKLPKVRWIACDDVLRELRIVKTKQEVDLLEAAAKHSESGIISC